MHASRGVSSVSEGGSPMGDTSPQIQLGDALALVGSPWQGRAPLHL